MGQKVKVISSGVSILSILLLIMANCKVGGFLRGRTGRKGKIGKDINNYCQQILRVFDMSP